MPLGPITGTTNYNNLRAVVPKSGPLERKYSSPPWSHFAISDNLDLQLAMSTALFKNIIATRPPEVVALSPYPSEVTVGMQMGDFSGSGIVSLTSAQLNRSTTQASSPG